MMFLNFSIPGTALPSGSSKLTTKASAKYSFPFTSMKEAISRGEEWLSIISGVSILDKKF
jgi:hypothetical protein